jgi:hypothetical protein
VKAGTSRISGSVQSREPSGPSSNNTTALAVNRKAANGMTHDGFQRDGLSVHVNSSTLCNKTEEGRPPWCRLAHVSCVQYGLHRIVDRLSDFEGRLVCDVERGSGPFVEECTVVEQSSREEDVRVFDRQWVVGHEFHVPQSDSCAECHVHSEADDPTGEGSFESFVSDDEGFALERYQPSVDHVKSDDSVHRLIGMDKGHWKLIAAANDAMAHALFFSHLLDGVGCSAPSINGAWLRVAACFSNHGKALLISAKIDAPAL